MLQKFYFSIDKTLKFYCYTKAVPCKRVGVAVMGMEVPHAHIHLIPINKESDMIISNPKLKLSGDEFKEIAERIHQAWNNK